MAIQGRTIPHDVLETYRFASVRLREEGVAVSIIALAFGVRDTSVYRWLSNGRRKGLESLKSTKAVGPPPLLSPEQFQMLLVWLRQPATKFGYATDLWSGPRIRHLLKHRCGVKYHPKHMPRLLRRLGLVIKFPERRALEQDPEKVREWKETRLPAIMAEAKRRHALVFYADESLISLIPYVGRTWTFPDMQPIVKVSGKRGQHVGVTGAVNANGKVCFEMTADGERFTSKVFLRFVRKLRKMHSRRAIFLIVDGAKVHTANCVKKFLSDNHRLRLEILPAYSPEWNPSEKVWRHVKCKSRNGSQAKDKAQLRQETRAALRRLQNDPSRIHAFFAQKKSL